jgi:Flp pilus assembly protein TadG
MENMNTFIAIRRPARRRERGQSLIEMALVFPLLILLVATVVDFGRAFHDYTIIANASREGARYASYFPRAEDLPGIQAQAIQEAQGSGLTLDPANVTAAPLPQVAGAPIIVTVTYDFPTILGGIVGANTLALRASTQMIVFGLDTEG